MRVCITVVLYFVVQVVGTRVILVENAPTCFRRVLAGKRALRSHVRRVVDCERLEDCRRECATERRFPCESFNYRLDPSFRGKGLCELMTKPIEAFDVRADFVEDKDYDFYEIDRNSLEPYCPNTLKGPGLLHSGFLSSKPAKVPGYKNGWRDRNSEYSEYNSYDESNYRGSNRRYENQIIPYQIGYHDDHSRGEYSSYGGYGGYSYYKDRNDYHKSMDHWQLPVRERPYTSVKHYSDTHDFDYYSLGNKSGWKNYGYGYGGSYGYGYGGNYGYGSKNSLWNTSGYASGHDKVPIYYETEPYHYESEGRNEPEQDCSSRRHAGMSLGSGAVRRALHAHNVVECEAACFEEQDFKCVSYSFKYSSPPGSDNCFLSERPYRGLEMSADSASDVYAMPVHQGCSVSTKPWVESECFWHVRSGAAVSGGVVKAALTVSGLGACEAECIRAHNFFCRGFSFRFEGPTIGYDIENCLLTSTPPTSLESGHGLRPSSGYELYARGNYGRGCEPAIYDDVNHKESQCYLQYDSSARLRSAAVSGRARAQTRADCTRACAGAPFQCRSFSYSENSPPGRDNCLLSQIRLFDLQKGVDYEHSAEDLLFSFDLFNGQCWKKIHRKDYETPTYDTPHPLLDSSYEVTYPGSAPDDSPPPPEVYISSAPSGPSGPSGPEYSGPQPPAYKTYPPGPSFPKHKPIKPVLKPVYISDDGPSGPPGPVTTSDLIGISGPIGPSSSYGATGPSGPYGASGAYGSSSAYGSSGFYGSSASYGSSSYYDASSSYGASGSYGASDSGSNRPYGPSAPYGPSGPLGPDPYALLRPSRPNYPNRPGYPGYPASPDYTDSGFKPSFPPKPRPSYNPYKPNNIDPGYKPAYVPGRPGYESRPDGKPYYESGYGSSRPNRPRRPHRPAYEEDGASVISWQHYTVSGFPCRKGTSCAQNHVAGHWACEPEGGEIGAWDYCCAPSHRCGYSEGFQKPWCYVGPSDDQWRPCSEKYYPYHQHKVPHPLQGDREAVHPRPDRQNDKTNYVPDASDRHQSYLPEADQKYWDDLYRNGPKAYYDKYGNPLPGYSRVPTEERPHIKYQRNTPRPSSGNWVPVEQEGDVPSKGLGVPRYWPVAYLHKGPPPNVTYLRYNETSTTEGYLPTPIQNYNNSSKTDRTTENYTNTKPFLRSDSGQEPRANDDAHNIKPGNINSYSNNLPSNTNEVSTTTVKIPNVTNNFDNTTEKNYSNNTIQNFYKAEEFKINEDYVKGIDDKLDDFTKSIEIFDLDDANTKKAANFKTLEAEEKQIEALGRLLASKRANKLVIQKRSQNELQSKNIAVDKDFINYNFENRFPTSERKGVVQKVTKEEIEKEKLSKDKSLEVSESTYVRPLRVLSTTENIRKAIINGKVFYDATIKDHRELFLNSTRKSKTLRLEDNKAPSIIPNVNLRKNIRIRSPNPVRRVKRVYRKRYNPDEVRRRLLERERSKQNTTEKKS